MLLKRIELAGFKSFADKTEMEFVPGITAVVGPNGSGKSNISDGIRWVLGEQSAKSLRGGKMEDVIFAGSDARKAVNYGEVSLTLDNSDRALPVDFSEVTVTRRVHRSGDSEYFINKQACRLKDITELFMDTGIGKEAYSIIGQGRIEEILSTKSEDRRGIFEEASGIVKYKSRKKEAERKLDDTEQNLLRIHDLVSELESQIEPLRDQSKKATQYKALKDELKLSEIGMYVYQIEQVHRSWTETNDKLAQLQLEQAGLAAIVGRHDAQLEQHRLETRRLDEELEQLQEKLLRISEDFEKCEGQGEVLKERQKNVRSNRQQVEQSVEQLDRRYADREVEISQLQQKIETIDQQYNQLLEQLQAEELRLLGVAGGLSGDTEDQLRSEWLGVQNGMTQESNEIRYADQQIDSLGHRVERIQEENRRWTDQKGRVESRRIELLQKLDITRLDITSIRERYMELAQQVQKNQAIVDEAQGATRRWEQKLDTTLSRRDTMKDLQDDYDGFMQGVKEVLKSKNRTDGLRGIHGAIAELVKVPANVEVAIETALGAAMQNIVVATESDGRDAIAFLKKRQLGRATFLPLDVIRSRSLSDQDRAMVQAVGGFVGIAADLVKFDETYRNIMFSLLGNVIIAESLEQANQIAARCSYRYRVVTLEGDVVNPGGSMTGGSAGKKTANLLGRQRLMEELEKEIKQIETELVTLQSTVQQARVELQLSNEKLVQLREEGETKRLEEQQYVSELTPLENEYKTANEQLALYDQDLISIQMEKAELATKKTVAEQTLQLLQVREQELQSAIQVAEQTRKAGESVKEELQGQLTDLKVNMASLAQEKQSLHEQCQRLLQDAALIMEEADRNRSTLTELLQAESTNEHESVSQIEQLNSLKLQKLQTTEQTEFKRAERGNWLTQLEREENETREQRQALKQVDDQLKQTEVRAGRLDVELDNQLKKLADEYELSFELAKSKYPVPDDVVGTQNKVREIKRNIQSLGEVNLGAIDEYARVSERFEFLSIQKQDLMAAKASLYEVIREMDSEMARRFQSTFDAIRSHFGTVFSKLFGGGRADLILSEPEHPLETGIEIVAQPPGKKLQNLQLLSGGERALTAIALLFAILCVKPVPFCVLDEVEAALDEANVTRFAEYLREFSNGTQFIVVTHRKGTMEESDVLYGVTMQEGGVSKLVSVRLEGDDEKVSA